MAIITVPPHSLGSYPEDKMRYWLFLFGLEWGASLPEERKDLVQEHGAFPVWLVPISRKNCPAKVQNPPLLLPALRPNLQEPKPAGPEQSASAEGKVGI